MYDVQCQSTHQILYFYFSDNHVIFVKICGNLCDQRDVPNLDVSYFVIFMFPTSCNKQFDRNFMGYINYLVKSINNHTARIRWWEYWLNDDGDKWCKAHGLIGFGLDSASALCSFWLCVQIAIQQRYAKIIISYFLWFNVANNYIAGYAFYPGVHNPNFGNPYANV